MKILILSDLHIGEPSRAKELCPYPSAKLKEDNLVNSFINYSKNYIKQNGEIDYLIIPGDITNYSNLIEYECGNNFLEKVLSELDIDEEKVIFVPGNHDIDWSVLKGIPDEEKKLRSSHKYNTLKDNRHKFSKLTGKELVEEPYIKKWEYADVVFCGFNSSWHDDAMKDNHYGLISEGQLKEMRKCFETIDNSKPKFFIVHHHLMQLKNPHPKWIDLSIMQNAQELLDLLAEFSFDFIIHGHRHVPHFSSFTLENFKKINLLCAGSFSREIPGEIAGYISNTFHIIDIDTFKNSYSKGKVLSIAYDIRNGWVNSNNRYGIEFVNPFGNHQSLDDIELIVLDEIRILLKIKEIILYSELISKIDELEYLTLKSKKELIKRVKNKLGLKTGNLDEDQLIFIKA